MRNTVTRDRAFPDPRQLRCRGQELSALTSPLPADDMCADVHAGMSATVRSRGDEVQTEGDAPGSVRIPTNDGSVDDGSVLARYALMRRGYSEPATWLPETWPAWLEFLEMRRNYSL